MPTYSYNCKNCNIFVERVMPIARRDTAQTCSICGGLLSRLLAAPLFKISGRVTPGGGPDKFTADMLRVPLKDLPKGLRTEKERK
jgi:putative FmdB family regulatory protein